MKKILEYNTFNREESILEMARLNDSNIPAIIINGYSQVNGGRSEHGIPHFDVKFKQLYLGSFFIPKKSDWLKSHNIQFFKGPNEKEALKYKKEVIKWLEGKNKYGYDNINIMRITWNQSNADNTNCILFDDNDEY